MALGLCFRYKSRRQLRVRVYSAERSQHLSRAGALSPTPYPDSPLPRAPLVPTTRRRQDLDEQSTAIPSVRGMPLVLRPITLPSGRRALRFSCLDRHRAYMQCLHRGEQTAGRREIPAKAVLPNAAILGHQEHHEHLAPHVSCVA